MMDREEIEQTNEEEIIKNEDVQKESIEELKEEAQKKELSKLYSKLEELQEKLSNEELSPMKRFLIENKLSIIETRLERQLAKMEIKDYKKEYEANKDEMKEIHNEDLRKKQEELDDIFEKIEEQERLIEQKTAEMKNRDIDYKEINNVGKTIIPRKNTRNTYQFTTNKKVSDILQKQQEKLEELKDKKDLKKEEIINFRKEFIEDEKIMDSEFQQQLKEYKPSIWQSFKKAFSRISSNFADWRKNSKQEKEIVKNAKNEARTNARMGQNIENTAKNRGKMKEFKDRVNYYIPLDEQKEYSKNAQEELENVEIDTIEDKTPTKWIVDNKKRKRSEVFIPISKKEKAEIENRRAKRKIRLEESEKELLELEQIIEKSELEEQLDKKITEEAENQILSDSKNLEEIQNSLSLETENIMVGIQKEIIKKEKGLEIQKVKVDEKKALQISQEKGKKMPEEQQK